jgi:hypothetical protein
VTEEFFFPYFSSDRKMAEMAPGVRNQHQMMFTHVGWQIVLVALVAISVVISTVNIIIGFVNSNPSELTCADVS